MYSVGESMRGLGRAFFLCSLLGAALLRSTSGAIAESAPVTGPIPIRNDYPLVAMHLTLEPQAGTVLPVGESRLSISGVWSNTNIVTDTYIVDDESFDTTFEFHRGMGGGFEFLAGLPLLWRGGGIMDDAVDGWHKFWGFPRGARDRTDDDSFNIEGVRRDARGFKFREDGFSAGNPLIGGKYSVLEGEFNSAALLGELSFPRFGGSYGHDGVDLTAGAALTSRLSWTTLHSGAAAVFYSDDEYSGVTYAPVHAEAFVVSENQFCGCPSLLVGLYGGTKTIDDITIYPDYFLYLDIGLRFPEVHGYAASLNMRENPTPHDGTTDISFVFAVERAWK